MQCAGVCSGCRARRRRRAERSSTLAPVAEFDTGVLLVHGIGVQRRAETLTEWSAPVLRWINAWLSGATDDIGQRLHGQPVESWAKSLAEDGGLRADR